MDTPAAADFIVCTYNNLDRIEATLAAIEAQTLPSTTCTVVDNRSTDGTPDLVRQRFPQVRVITKTVNSGPAGSRNIGAAAGRAPYIVFVDSDVVLPPDWAERQIAFLRARPNAGIACGKLLFSARRDTIQSAYGAINRIAVGWDGGTGVPADGLAQERRCIWTTTAALIVRREVMERIGGFDEVMFAYHEDLDFGWRASIAGYDVVYNPDARALHDLHGTMNGRTMGSGITFHLCKNRLRAALVNYETASAIRYVPVYLALTMLDMLRGEAYVKAKALAWNVKHLPGTLRRRRVVQKLRRVRDRELWPLFERGFRGPGRRNG